MFIEKISTLDRLDALGVMPTVEDRAESGADEVDRRMRTRIRPLLSTSDSVHIGSRPSSEMTSPSSSIFAMEAAVGPGNWFRMSWVAALYSNRKRRRVYLQKITSKQCTLSVHTT